MKNSLATYSLFITALCLLGGPLGTAAILVSEDLVALESTLLWAGGEEFQMGESHAASQAVEAAQRSASPAGWTAEVSVGLELVSHSAEMRLLRHQCISQAP